MNWIPVLSLQSKVNELNEVRTPAFSKEEIEKAIFISHEMGYYTTVITKSYGAQLLNITRSQLLHTLVMNYKILLQFFFFV